MGTICVAGHSSVSIGVLIDTLELESDFRVVGLPNPSDVPGSRTRWQPSFREKLHELSVPEVSLKWCEDNPNLIFVSCEYENLLNIAKFSTTSLYNLHFSLLPAHKGAYPTTFAVMRGDTIVGPTLHRIDAGIDTGPIVAQLPTPISPDMTALDVYMICQISGRQLLRENLDNLLSGSTCERQQQPEGSTFGSRNDLDFAALRNVYPKASAEQVQRRIAAANFRPYQLPTFNGAIISGSRILETQSRQRHGTILHQDETVVRIATIDFDMELIVDQYPQFWDACRKSRYEDFESLLPLIQRVDEYNEIGRRALYYAVESESIRICRLLLEHGASINDLDGFGTDAYSLAMSLPSSRAQRELLKIFGEAIENGLPFAE